MCVGRGGGGIVLYLLRGGRVFFPTSSLGEDGFLVLTSPGKGNILEFTPEVEKAWSQK